MPTAHGRLPTSVRFLSIHFSSLLASTASIDVMIIFLQNSFEVGEHDLANLGTRHHEFRTKGDIVADIAAPEAQSPASHTEQDIDRIRRSPLPQERALPRLHRAEEAERRLSHSGKEREQDSTYLLPNPPPSSSPPRP